MACVGGGGGEIRRARPSMLMGELRAVVSYGVENAHPCSWASARSRSWLV